MVQNLNGGRSTAQCARGLLDGVCCTEHPSLKTLLSYSFWEREGGDNPGLKGKG